MATYDVTWRPRAGVNTVGKVQNTRVDIIPGYTTVNDIPKIIAVSRTGRPGDSIFIEILEIDHVRPE